MFHVKCALFMSNLYQTNSRDYMFGCVYVCVNVNVCTRGAAYSNQDKHTILANCSSKTDKNKKCRVSMKRKKTTVPFNGALLCECSSLIFFCISFFSWNSDVCLRSGLHATDEFVAFEWQKPGETISSFFVCVCVC